jgi:hypothetical protein
MFGVPAPATQFPQGRPDVSTPTVTVVSANPPNAAPGKLCVGLGMETMRAEEETSIGLFAAAAGETAAIAMNPAVINEQAYKR